MFSLQISNLRYYNVVIIIRTNNKVYVQSKREWNEDAITTTEDTVQGNEFLN